MIKHIASINQSENNEVANLHIKKFKKEGTFFLCTAHTLTRFMKIDLQNFLID